MTADERKDYMREWRAKNRDAINAYKRNYFATHPQEREKRNAQASKWQCDHPDEVRRYHYLRRMAKAKEQLAKEHIL